MAVNQFNHRQVACKIVSLTKLKEKLGVGEVSKFKFGRPDRPKAAKKVNHKTELKKVQTWSRRTKQALELADKLKTYDREVEILQSLNHVSCHTVNEVSY